MKMATDESAQEVVYLPSKTVKLGIGNSSRKAGEVEVCGDEHEQVPCEDDVNEIWWQ